MTIIEILKEAREKIAKPENWCKGDVSKDANGIGYQVLHPEAVCWCAIGSIGDVTGNDWQEHEEAILAIQNAVDIKDDPNSDEYALAAFNDNHTHAEVLAAFDAAIAVQEAL